MRRKRETTATGGLTVLSLSCSPFSSPPDLVMPFHSFAWFSFFTWDMFSSSAPPPPPPLSFPRPGLPSEQRHDFTMSAIPRGLQDGWYKDELTEEQLKDNYIGNDIGLFDPKLFEGKLAGPTLGQIYRHQRKVHQDPEASS